MGFMRRGVGLEVCCVCEWTDEEGGDGERVGCGGEGSRA